MLYLGTKVLIKVVKGWDNTYKLINSGIELNFIKKYLLSEKFEYEFIFYCFINFINKFIYIYNIII